MAHRVLKSSEDVTLSEHTLSDGSRIISRGYTVKSRRTFEVPNFTTLGEADVYFDAEVLRALNSKQGNHAV